MFTPPLRDLTPDTSLGFDCAEFASAALGLRLLPWQKWFLVHALELLPSGVLRFRKVVLLVARQNGKTLLSQVLSLYFIYALGARTVLGTAQDLTTAEDIWQDTYDIAAGSELLAGLLTKPKLGKGAKEFGLVGRGTYRVKAANRRGGRGQRQVKLVLFSEAREQQTWDAWAAVTKTTNAVDEALVLCESNAGDAASVVLRYLRLKAHAALGDPDGWNAEQDPELLLDEGAGSAGQVDDSLAIFEWSASPGCDVWDRDGWAQANPSLGHIITERTIASDAATDPEWTFRTEVLCQWACGALSGPFPPGAWDAGRVTADTILPMRSVPVACVEVSWDRSRYAIAYAGWTEAGPQVETVAERYDPRGAVAWLASADRAVRPSAVVVRSTGPAAVLAEDLRDAGFIVIEWSGADVSEGCALLYDAVAAPPPVEGQEPARCGPLRHAAHTLLDVAASVAVTRPYGDRWSWDMQKSPVDIACLYAATGAVWALLTGSEARVSAYEARGVMTI
nr:MAG TPA: Large Terminase [Caudoviricetes sp.]